MSEIHVRGNCPSGTLDIVQRFSYGASDIVYKALQ
jgi:hypothetical protein